MVDYYFCVTFGCLECRKTWSDILQHAVTPNSKLGEKNVRSLKIGVGSEKRTKSFIRFGPFY